MFFSKKLIQRLCSVLVLLGMSIFSQSATAQTSYSTVTASHSGKCADVEAGGWNTGDRVIQYACHNGDNQQWTLAAYNGSYQMIVKRTGQCLSVAGDSSQAGAPVVQYPCGAYTNQLWDIKYVGNTVQMLARQTGMCLAVQNGSLQDVAALVQQPCAGVASELWNFTNTAVLPPATPPPPPGPAGYSTIISSPSGKCADVEAGGWDTGARIIQYACHNGDNQQWTLTANSGAYRIVGKRLGECLTPSAGASQANTPMVQLACGAYPNQLWTVKYAGNAVQLIGEQTGMCLTVQNASLQDAALLVQQPCQGTPSELWNFSNTSVLPPPTTPPSGTTTTIVAGHSAKCLTIAGSQSAAGSPASQASCDGSAAQSWKLTAAGDAYTVALNASGLCLAIEGASQTPAAAAVLAACNGAPDTLWTLQQSGATASLVARHSGQCLDIYGSSQSDGAAAIQYHCSGTANQAWTLSAPPPASAPPTVWSPLIPFPIVPVAAVNLPDGKVLTWSAYAPDNFGDDNQWGRTYSAIFDPVTLATQSRVVTETGHDMFCPGTSLLPDGRLLVNGGSSSQKTSIYNPANSTWSAGPLMNIARGYPGNTTLANGSVLTLGGSWSGGQGGKIGEIWTAAGGWKKMPGIPIDPFIGADPGGVFRGDNHLWLFPFSNGRVFHAGPTAAMHWIATGGTGTVTFAGNRNDDAYSMNGNAVMYDIGKILKTGGAPAYENAYSTSAAYVIDLTSGTTRKLGPMHYARAMHNSVVLPNGQVVISGGQTYVKIFSDDRSVLMTELWDPKTEAFTKLSAMQVPRNYHSFSLLLPDGRVLIGGGGLCGACTTNHADAQVLTPPYLLNADGSPAPRPAITFAPASGTAGGTLSVSTDTAASSFVLMRLSAVTHSVNNDQRRVPLQVTAQNGNSYTLQLPADRGIILPGNYMLFALNERGVPSISKTLQIR